MNRLAIATLLLSLIGAAQVSAQQTLLLRDPDVSAGHIAFVYAGDIWIANRDGSSPYRLTTSPADERDPIFSPDGEVVAFTARFENNTDVYVVEVSGGQPKRLTWHPGNDVATGWTSGGSEVAFVSARETDHGRSGQLFSVNPIGGMPQKVMNARVYRGKFDAANDRFAYIPFGSGYNGLFGGSSGWKGYRGGTTPEIHILNFRNSDGGDLATVPGAGSTNFNPMWLDQNLFFISDRDDKTFNIFRYDGGIDSVSRISSEEEWDIRSAGAHGNTIVYEAGGRLKALDVNSGSTEEILINIDPDLPQMRTRWKSAAGNLQGASISPTGKRVIVTARGDVFTVPIEEGSTRNISSSASNREYTAIWSPSGEEVAYVRDSRDGQSLVVTDQYGAVLREHDLGSYFYELDRWVAEPVSRITFTDNHLTLYSINAESGAIEQISTGARREDIETSVSPDGHWLAFTEEQPNLNRQLFLYNFESGERHAVTDVSADVASPAFSRDGSYLYFAASTNSGPTQIGLNMTSQERPYRAALYAAVLSADGKSPLLDDAGDEDSSSTENEDDSDGDKADEAPAVQIDIGGIADRIVALPLAERNYANLNVDADGNLYYIQRVQPGISNEPPGRSLRDADSLRRFDFEEKKASRIYGGVGGYEISANGKTLLIATTDGELETAEVGEDIDPESIDLGGLRMRINPREEWTLIFDEVWRMEKEFFYDPGMHGLDWDAVYQKYRPLVDHVGRREDLNELMVEMIAEMQVGHNRTQGGDVYSERDTDIGLLGANFVTDSGRYQIEKVYTGESWNPFERAPLATPGNHAIAGEYLLAVNGSELTANDNLFEFLQGTVDEQVQLRVGPSANGRDARDITVEPVESERLLRLWDWIEDNRRKVGEATDGRVGYVYLPNTAGAGYTYFNRMFFSQLDKDAIIIDERSNGGGQAANYITDVLSRRHLSGWKDRDGMVYNTPAGALHGPKVMLIDQDAGSGGDYLPYSFRTLGIGKLIGTRTWGGLIGISANPSLVDGGRLVVPFFRFYDTNHEWTVENEGVAPDIEVSLDPIATNEGRDTQLEAAIAEILSQLEDFMDPIPDRAPAYPTELGQ